MYRMLIFEVIALVIALLVVFIVLMLSGVSLGALINGGRKKKDDEKP